MATKRLKTFTARDAALAIITPSVLDHKYSRGTLGVIAGSAQYPGAAVLTTSAALATGIGINHAANCNTMVGHCRKW